MEFELTIKNLLAPFLAIFTVLGKLPLLFAKQKLRLPTRKIYVRTYAIMEIHLKSRKILSDSLTIKKYLKPLSQHNETF